ncbi:MAG: DUF2179 domain-containing protein [Bacteroidales bacterium]|jgi:uncharacterized protein YebE (UPF0316 family)|nr:DUF2179 domain-containing protein [Bacteroidales bacterium]
MTLIVFDWQTWVLIPLFIFVARIFDVSIGTLRIILVNRGYKTLAPILGFVEVFIWVIAISKIMENLDNWINYIFYAAGFATGNFVGMYIEEKLAIGKVGVRIVTKRGADKLIKSIADNGFGITYIDAQGKYGDVHVIYSTCKRKRLHQLLALVHEYNPKAFYTIEDIRFANQNYDTPAKIPGTKRLFSFRKGK